jgi:nitroreductase
MCAIECPAAIIEIAKPKALPTLAAGGEERCIVCGHCVAVCPKAAIALDKMRPEQCALLRRELLPSAEQVDHLLKTRRSLRAYKKKPVPHEVLARLIDIARYAPSGHNSQPVQWLVVEDPGETRRLAGLVVDWMRAEFEASPSLGRLLHFDTIVAGWDKGRDPVLRGAPHVIVAHASKGEFLPEVNCTIALTYLELAAYSLGLGACWAGWLQAVAQAHPPVAEALRLPDGHQSFGAMMVGYPRHRFARIPLRNEPTIIWR